MFVLNTVYNSVFKNTEQHPYCMNCFNRVRKVLEGSSTLVLIEDNIPDDKNLVLPQFLVSINSINPVRSVGCSTIRGGVEIDISKDDISQLKHSLKNESFEGCQIGDPKYYSEEMRAIDNDFFKNRIEDKSECIDGDFMNLEDVRENDEKDKIEFKEKKKLECD